jgi:hypothetical protein
MVRKIGTIKAIMGNSERAERPCPPWPSLFLWLVFVIAAAFLFDNYALPVSPVLEVPSTMTAFFAPLCTVA